MRARHQRTQTQQRRIERPISLQAAIFDAASYSIISADTGGTILSFNRAAERVLGYSAGEVVGKMTALRLHDAEEIDWRAVRTCRRIAAKHRTGF